MEDDDEELFVRRFEMLELMKATNNFSQDCLLGSGGFGSVYRGILDAEVTVAIKKPHADSYQSVQEFRNGEKSMYKLKMALHFVNHSFLYSPETEVKLLSKVKHKNLLALVGYCEEPGEPTTNNTLATILDILLSVQSIHQLLGMLLQEQEVPRCWCTSLCPTVRCSNILWVG